MRGTHTLYLYVYRFPVRIYSHALQEQKSHTNKSQMQNVHAISRLFHVLSNGALVFTISLIILCTGKWIELFAETLLAFNLHFQLIGINLQENQVHHSKER
jgi:hypothetical protein